MNNLIKLKKWEDYSWRKNGQNFDPMESEIYNQRSYKVEPMQALVKDILGLDHCWMRGDVNNRWIFAAMGLTI